MKKTLLKEKNKKLIYNDVICIVFKKFIIYNIKKI